MDVERILISGARILSLVGALYTTVCVSWASLAWTMALVVSIFVIKPNSKQKGRIQLAQEDLINGKYNPLKGKPKRTSEEEIPDHLRNKINKDILKLTLHDPIDTESLHNFEIIKQNSQCVFAKGARVWGSRDWNYKLSLEENIFRNIPSVIRFCHLCQHLGLDSFLFEVPNKYASNVKIFGDTVRRVLTVLSDHDPDGLRCMDKSYIDKIGWVFEFNRVTCFVTTFAPFYPETHSRYAYGSDSGFIMLQPEISFAQHDLSPDTPHTNWENPKTVRDRIRKGFRDAGMPYTIRDTVRYPMVLDVVKPVREEDGSVEWWKKNKQD